MTLICFSDSCCAVNYAMTGDTFYLPLTSKCVLFRRPHNKLVCVESALKETHGITNVFAKTSFCWLRNLRKVLIEICINENLKTILFVNFRFCKWRLIYSVGLLVIIVFKRTLEICNVYIFLDYWASNYIFLSRPEECVILSRFNCVIVTFLKDF